MPGITKKDRPLTAEHFAEFEKCYGADPNDFYLDHDGTYSFTTTTYAMWPWLATSDSLGLPWATIIDAETYEYVYTNQSDPGNTRFESTMVGLLAP